MKLKIKGHDLISAIRSAASGLATRDIKPILKSFLFQAVDGQLLVESTDLEMGVIATAPCEVPEPGKVCIPGTCGQLLDGLDDKEISVETIENRAIISGSGFKFELATQVDGGFPSYKQEDTLATLPVNPEWMAQSIKFSKLDDYRDDRDFGAINGLCLDIRDKKINAVSTNRIILTATTIDTEFDGEIQVVLPRKFLPLISATAGKGQGLVFCTARSTASFASPGLLVWTRLIEGRYPPWRKVAHIPVKPLASVLAGELSTAIKRACYFLSQDSIRVKLAFGDNLVVSNTNGSGEGFSNVSCTISGNGSFDVNGLSVRSLLSTHKPDEKLQIGFAKSSTEFMVIDFEMGRHSIVCLDKQPAKTGD